MLPTNILTPWFDIHKLDVKTWWLLTSTESGALDTHTMYIVMALCHQTKDQLYSSEGRAALSM